MELIEHLEKITETYLKHLENRGGLHEIRIKQESDIFRPCCFFDKGKLIVLANRLQQKEKKIPKKKIEKT